MLQPVLIRSPMPMFSQFLPIFEQSLGFMHTAHTTATELFDDAVMGMVWPISDEESAIWRSF
jgi:hypothetical protein